MQNHLDKEYETAAQAAQRLGLNPRTVQKYASQGRIPGAVRHGRSWLIPIGYEPPKPAAQEDGGENAGEDNGIPDVYRITPFRQAMPLLNSAYAPGGAQACIDAMADADDRQIAQAEYCLFSGRAEEAAQIVEPYMDSHDPALRYSANLIGTFANIGRGHIHLARFAMGNLQRQITAGFQAHSPVQFHAMGVFTATAAAVLLHMPTDRIPPLEAYMRHLPGGMKLYACYILAHKAYLQKDYGKCLTLAEIALALCPQDYPIAQVYVHIAAAMALANLKRMDEAKAHIASAWAMAEPDGLIQPFSEHHGLLQGLVEVYFKDKPDTLPRIIEITYAFSAGWRKIHNPDTRHDVADNLTTTEFTIAMLYNRGWMVKEIAEHMEMSMRTVSRHIAVIYEKLGISDKKKLEQFMLR